MKVDRLLGSSDPDVPQEVPIEIWDPEYEDDLSSAFEKKRKPKKRRTVDREEGER